MRFVNSAQGGLEDMVKSLKIRFTYDQVARRFSLEHPKSLRLMFYKSLFSIERLNNKYLTLTTITHLNLYSKKNLSYLSQLRTKISELYFVERSATLGTSSQQYYTSPQASSVPKAFPSN